MTLRLPSPGTKPDPTPVPRILAALLVVLAWAFPTSAQVPPAPTGREFPPGSWSRLSELPDGPFRRQLERAPDAARGRALERLRRFHFTAADLPSLRLDAEGGVYYADGFPGSATATTAPATSPLPSDAAVPVSPFPAGLVLHSRPGAANVLFLNFSGETVSGTAWNSDLGRSQIPATAFSTDADAATFSTAEQDAIRRIWQRVSEDYAPFNIDVTTERPGTFNNRTAHLLVTRNTDANGSPNPSSTAGGVAYVDVFGRNGYATYRPAWGYANNLGNAEANIAEAASHEVGHNLGLSHDGTTAGSEYYGGHGSGDISWGPLMGAPYGRNVTQWSRGDYRQANNSQDDLAILASKVGYRPDDHGNTPGTATPVVVGPDGAIRVTTPEDDPDNTDGANQGVLERSGDVDVFSLVSGTGRLVVDIAPWRVVSGTTRGGNADLQVELRDAAGSLVAIDDPPARTTARLDVVVPEGAYYLHIRGTGTGDPLATTPTGYVPYGSLGQYFLSGQLVPSGFILPPIAELQSGDLTRNGLAEWEFNVTYSDDVAIATATLDDNDLRGTGPAGYDRPARLVRVDAAGDGSPRIATYAAPPPDGNVWIPADNGTYTILLTDGQVSDTTGATAIGGPLGAFQVAIPAAVYAASLDSDPGWTLEGLWAYGPPRYPGAGPTGGRTGTRILAYNLSGNYENRLNPTWATTPPIDCSGASTLTLRFQRWLRLRNGDTATVQVSTNGTDWADLWSTRRTVSDSAWREIQLALPRWTDGASALRLRWGITSGASQSDIGWNLDDIEVLSGGTLDTRPPTPAFSAADVTLPGATTHSFTVTYTDDSAVAVASLGSGDLEVLDPAGSPLAVTLEAVDPAGDGTPRTATYSVGAPGGVWDPDDNGTYQVLLLENEVGDLANNLTPAGILGTFAVSIPVDPLTLLVTPAVLPVEEGRQAGFLVRANRPPAGPLPVEIRQVKDFIDHAAEFRKAGATLLMVYPGPAGDLEAHAAEFRSWKGREWPAEVPFVLDPDYTMVHAYALRWEAPGETAYPSTFVIGADNRVRCAQVSRSHGGRTRAADILKQLPGATP